LRHNGTVVISNKVILIHEIGDKPAVLLQQERIEVLSLSGWWLTLKVILVHFNI
jgi:hypothetical protein